MANLKVGDRVRIAHNPRRKLDERGWIGKAGVIEFSDCNWGLLLWVVRTEDAQQGWFEPDELEPLVPPDAWASEKVKQVTKPQHMEPAAPVPVWP